MIDTHFGDTRKSSFLGRHGIEVGVIVGVRHRSRCQNEEHGRGDEQSAGNDIRDGIQLRNVRPRLADPAQILRAVLTLRL
jgi:hypothetical protein